MSKKLKQKYREPDLETANQMLTNIFEELNLQSPSKSLETMNSYTDYRRERFVLQKVIIITALVLYLLLPILFISPKATLTEAASADGSPAYVLRLSFAFPVSSVTATVGEYAYAVSEIEDNVYLIRPTVNGELNVRVKYMNLQYRDLTAEVSSIDDQPPTITDSSLKDGRLILTAEDSGSGINYDNIFLKTSDGSYYYPTSYEPASGIIKFDVSGISDDSVIINIPDTLGNALQLLVSLE